MALKQNSILVKFKIAFHRYEIKTIPMKIHSWSNAINHKLFPKNTSDAIDDLFISLHALSNNLDEWFQSDKLPQKTLFLNETKEELEQWKLWIENIFQSYQSNFGYPLSNHIEDELKQHINNLEDIINKHEDYSKQKNLSIEDRIKLYRIVGSYQGLSYTMIAYASATEKIDWSHWQEEVFA